MAPFPFMSQRYYQFSRFILQYNKMHHIQSTYQLIRRHVESNQSVNMAEVIEVEIEQASEQEQRGREDEVVSVLSRLRPPVASDFFNCLLLCSGIRVLAKHLWQIAIFN